MRRLMKYAVIAFLAVALIHCSENNPEQEPQNQAAEIVEVVDYHDNGMVSMRGNTLDGKRHGQWESFYPSGLKWSETTFRHGVKEGPTVTFFSNGMMRYSGYYHDDTRSGIWQLYDSSGTLFARIDMDIDPTRGDSLINKSILGH